MATKPVIPASPPKQILRDSNLVLALGLVENGIVIALNDSFIKEVNSYKLPFYASKIEGKTMVKNYSDISHVESANQVNGPGKGFFIYNDPRTNVDERSHKITAFGDKIFAKIGDRVSLLRDVADDGYVLDFMSADQEKKYMYIAIGDTTQSAKLYKYDGTVNNTGSISSVADNGSGEARFYVPATHELNIGDYVKIDGTTNYDGEYSVKDVSDTAHFDLEKSFAGTDTGTIEGNPLLIEESMTTMDASYLLGKMQDRLISASLADKTRGLYSQLEVDGDFDDFTSGNGVADGGQLSGVTGAITATAYSKGSSAIFSENSVTFHTIKPPLYTGGATISELGKDATTLIEGVTLDNKGVASQKSVCVGRDSIFFADPRGSIFMYNTSFKPAIRELSADFRETLKNYDLKNSSVCYDPTRDSLYVTASTSEDIANDTIFIYNFKSKGWSIDTGKRVGQLLFDDFEQKVYGVSSIEPKLFQVFDGTHTNEGSPIRMTVYTRAYSNGRYSRLKEYQNSSFEVGFVDATEKFEYNIYTDDNPLAQASEEVDVSDVIFIPDSVSAEAPWGDGIFAGGWAQETDRIFKNHYNEDSPDDFKKIVQMVTEESAAPFLVGMFEIEVLPTDDETDEI